MSQADIRVAICDEQPVFARGLATLLQSEERGFSLGTVTTDPAQLEAAVADAPPDVILMGMAQADPEYVALIERLGTVVADTRIVVLTNSESQEDLELVLQAGASGYVLKHRDVSEIAEATRSVNRGLLVVPSELSPFKGAAAPRRQPLSEADREVLAGIARGETNKQIASRLYVSERTLRRRMEKLYARLGLADRTDAAIFATRRGLGTRRRKDEDSRAAQR